MARPTDMRRIEIQVPEEEHALVLAAATTAHETLSEFVRRAARARAERTLEERTRIALDERSARRFLDALDDPARFDAGLRRLSKRSRVLPR